MVVEAQGHVFSQGTCWVEPGTLNNHVFNGWKWWNNPFLCNDLVHHPIETTIKNGLFGVPGRCSELPLLVGSVSSERSPKKTEGFFSKTPGHGNWPRFWAMFFERADVGVTRGKIPPGVIRVTSLEGIFWATVDIGLQCSFDIQLFLYMIIIGFISIIVSLC